MKAVLKRYIPPPIKKFARKAFSILPEKLSSLEFPQEKWDIQYATKQWDYLNDLTELPRYSIITGYVNHFNANASVLEVGCGTGLLYSHLKNLPISKYRGIDLSCKAIEVARQTYKSDEMFQAADGKSYVENCRYGFIIFNESLYYFDDCLAVLKHYKQILDANGMFIVSMVVGANSDSHWKKIGGAYQIIDAVHLRNRKDLAWNCKVLKPSNS